MTAGLKYVALPCYLAACLLLGGASAAGVAANLTLQLVGALIISLLLCLKVEAFERSRTNLLLLAVLITAIGWPLLQLLPLPPMLWQALPGRDSVGHGDRLLGMGAVWRPISMQPAATIASLLGFVPAIAAFGLASRASHQERLLAIGVVIAVAIASSMVGFIQIAHGPGSAAYLYRITNNNTSVGFFANSNHLATYYVIVALFVVDLRPFKGAGSHFSTIIISATLFLYLLINIALNRSIAGYLLATIALLYGGYRVSARETRAWLARLCFVALALAALVLALVGSSNDLASALLLGVKSSTDPVQRLVFFTNTLVIAQQMFPVGSGLGTFRWVYAGLEPLQDVTLTFVNHAHNDYLELWAELGLPALAVFAGSALWMALQAVVLFRGRTPRAPYLAACWLALLVIALHSAVDYPARTSAIAAVAGMCIGFLTRQARRPTATPAPRSTSA